MKENILDIVNKVKIAKMIFLKLIKSNDVGATGAHQAGFHLPKNSWRLFFDSPGIKGHNKDKYVTIRWHETFETESRAIYYGQGTRNEYRLTRFGLNFPYLKEQNIDSLLIIIRNFDNTYEGFVVDKKDIDAFLRETRLEDAEFNSLIINEEEGMQLGIFKEENNEDLQKFPEEDLFPSQIDGLYEEVKSKVFKPKAHILTLLGDELIKNPVMAIYELVKNGYDADALKVNVYFNDIEDLDTASIVIEDDGTGMTSEVIENVWLEPGSDYRKPVNPVTGIRNIVKSPLYGRVPMGEKGVGRFAVHKLGTKILLITRPLLITYNEDKTIEKKTLADYEIILYINWKDFNQTRHLSDIPITWKIRRNPSVFRFRDQSGTYIRISGLKENWTKGMARELKNHTMSMLSPKLSDNSFKINLNFNNEWLKGSSTIDDFLRESPYKISAFVDEQFNLIFEYEFSLINNPDIGKREIKNNKKYDRNIKGFLKPYLRDLYEQNGYDKIETSRLLEEFEELMLSPFGSLLFEFYSYDLDSISMRDYSSDANMTKTILKEQAGIKVFKGDLRVFDYGEKGNDWLGIDLERIQNKEWFSNNQNVGYVYLDPEQSISLVEKTNREGFVHNDSYNLFFIVLRYLLTEFKNTRLVDRKRWLNYNRKVSDVTFSARIQNFRKLIEDSDINTEDKKQKLIIEAEKLETKYDEDTKALMIPAGVGMTASVALHEIEKLVPRMEETAKHNPIDRDMVKSQVEELRLYTEGIISVLRKGGKGNVDVNDAIKRAIAGYDIKMKDRNIKIVYDLDENIGYLNVEKRFLFTIIMNLVDNSIYWLDNVNRERPSIYVKSFNSRGITTIIIADNGPGFKDEISEVVTPFFSRKNNGIGIGLYLVDTIMMKYGKFDIIELSEAIDYGVPEIYTGAIIKLSFNKI
ncbi:ATP-binding protein [Bacteroides fragilis]|nr:ATP-binding protein [Bacteroides fragilis]